MTLPLDKAVAERAPELRHWTLTEAPVAMLLCEEKLQEVTRVCLVAFYKAVADAFVTAHTERPGGLSIEIGTYEGVTSKLMLRLLDVLYTKSENTPWLITCDPYGGKPYLNGMRLDDGRVGVTDGNYFGAECYAKAKMNLCGFPNHAHYPVTSFAMLRSLPEMWPYPQRNRKITFALLDGEHNAETIVGEVGGVLALDPQAYVLVDNADADRLTVPELEKRWKVTEILESAAPDEEIGKVWHDTVVKVEPK